MLFFYYFFVGPYSFRWKAIYGDPVYPEGFDVHGIDVSHYQENIDWERLRNASLNSSPVSFVFIKATEGTTLLDDNFNLYFYEAKQNDFIRGAYHFFLPDVDAQKQANLLVFLAGIGRYILMGLQLLITIPLIFIIFPQTEGLAYRILGYIWNPIRGIFVGIIDYIPKLFTIIIIWYAVRYLVRLVHYLAREIEAGRLKFNGFYPDWAMPTFHIVRFLLYAFMIAMIYPYLPGSDSGVFQGISVFVGLIVSLGSSTVIGNIIAGLVITYMRPFKLGDRIKLNDTTGDIIEKTPLVTRIRTPKNEVVTVPNSFIMSSHTVNYSTSAREYGLIIHSEVSIGYDIPWRQVNQILIDAALNTPGVVDDPRPFVLETSLSDWYPVYQINAYIKQADKMAQIYSDLHQNIQDKFNEAGIEIMSPHYMAVRDGNESTIQKGAVKNSGPAKTAEQGDVSEKA